MISPYLLSLGLLRNMRPSAWPIEMVVVGVVRVSK